jgi:hypothetical protein
MTPDARGATRARRYRTMPPRKYEQNQGQDREEESRPTTPMPAFDRQAVPAPFS